MKVQIAEARGPVLNWLVSTITNPEWSDEDRWRNTIGYVDTGDVDDEPYDPSTNPALAQPLIERFHITTMWRGERLGWWACISETPEDDDTMGYFGETALIAAMLAYVFHVFSKGDEDFDGMVEVPEGLT